MENQDLDILKKIVRVETPPFLLTRIEARLQQPTVSPWTVRWAFALAGCLTLLLVTNAVLLTSSTTAQSQMELLSSELLLTSSNQLYNE